MKLYIIGAGGTASYMLPALIRSFPNVDVIDGIVLIDRDDLEEKNLERQNFEAVGLGKPKVEILAEQLAAFSAVPIESEVAWFTESTTVEPGSFIISCTDNHPARRAVLAVCDETESQAVICGNETFSADAYYYHPSFKGTILDPRKRYPEILTDNRDDPTRPSCNDEKVVAENPQLAEANNASAELGLKLALFYLVHAGQMDANDKKVQAVFPIEFSSTRAAFKSVVRGDLEVVA